MNELPKIYDPRRVEQQINDLWQQGDCFHPEPDDRPADQRFCIVIPPPNVTGALHLGHALNNTLQDVLVRWHRMMGHNTLWVPGTDHAGIATQAVVEKRLFEEIGRTRHDIGREALVQRIWDWKDQYEARIINQLKLMGCSCDFKRTRFTLDEGCSRAVRETFFRLFKDGYIYRGKRLVNWDCELQTAVADDEVYHETVKGKFYHIKYQVVKNPDCSTNNTSDSTQNLDSTRHAGCYMEKDIPDHLIIATTRPETMLGDTAVAVNPNDERYKHLIGMKVKRPLDGREIPIIADEHADPTKGTGCVKITPAHDPNDYEVGLRHNLPMVNILNPDGTINQNGGKYAGMDRFAARDAVVVDLEALGLIEKIEDHEHEVGHSDRSKSMIEPYLSDQWFIKMSELAEPTLEAVRSGSVRFVPERYKSAYLDWLGEKRDWCISRQLWWGHRIPVWLYQISYVGNDPNCFFDNDPDDQKQFHKAWNMINELPKDVASCKHFSETNELPWEKTNPNVADIGSTYAVTLLEDHPEIIEKLKDAKYIQDSDVLDTWFSSALWPLSTLGWPSDSSNDERPTTNDERPTTNDERPTTNDERPTTNDNLLDYYYPTNVLITSRDIITLWVVRMVLMGLYNANQKPFHDVYIHPKILDGRGVGMSKSKGNGVDPLDIIEAFGADAMRFCLAGMTTETQDIRMPVSYRCPHCEALTPQTEKNMFGKDGNPSKVLACSHCKKEFATRWASENDQQSKGLALMVSEKFESARNFNNKLWNAARFAFMNLESSEPRPSGSGTPPLQLSDLLPEDRWILAELSEVVRQVNAALKNYQYGRAVSAMRNYFWDCLCDWYLELVKHRISENQSPAAARQVLAFCLDQSLRLMHPVIPFITERLWQQLNEVAPQRGLPGLFHPLPDAHQWVGGRGSDVEPVLTMAKYPPEDGYSALDDAEIRETFEDIQRATRAVREARNTAGVAPKDTVRVSIRTRAERAMRLRHESHILRQMGGISELTVDPNGVRPKGSAIKIVGELQIFVHDLVNDEKERKNIEKNLVGVGKRIASTEGKLNNEGYIRSAPPEVVEETRQILSGLKEEKRILSEMLRLLN